ncbi:MAG: tetratricopeptide repeat protein [Pseudomonadota bacterium]|nr:tetratricopeptide repeat protein [Pseudomonadota bacterium]
MKRIIVILFALSSLPALAEESAWQKSYQLEAGTRYAEALAALNGVEESADAGFALSRRGWLAYLQGKNQDAHAFYKRALERNPGSLEARLGITLPLLAQQRWREAAMYARQVIAESAWDYTAHVRLLAALEGQRDWRSMAEHAERLVERYPSDTTAWVYLARAQAWLGDVREARKAYSRTLERYPDHLEATRYLASKP